MTTTPVITADTIVGERVMLELFRRRITKRALAGVLQISEGAMGKKINGASTFTLDELLMISRHLDLAITDLLPGNDYDPVLTGQGRKGRVAVVRHQGLEPRTR